MPSQILHTLFGEDVINEIYRRIGGRFGIVADKALEKIQLTHRAAFALGCQGPDVFYHSQTTRPVALEYGALLHRRAYGVFTAALLKMGLPDPPPDAEDIRLHRREKGIGALGAYALGFMTHAILDRSCHPYIIYKSGWVSRGNPETRKFAGAHAFFERLLDVLMLERLRGRAAASWDQETLAAICTDPPLGLKELLARALVSAFPERAGKDARLSRRMENTFSDCAFFYRFTDPQRTSLNRSGRPRGPVWARRIPVAYLYPEDFPRELDYLNLEKTTWYSPEEGGGADDRSFPELYAGAVKGAADNLSVFIAQYLETGVFPIKEAAQSIGNGGLSLNDGTGKPCAPVRSDPLPLDGIMAGQRILRSGGQIEEPKAAPLNRGGPAP
jgi:hypothetical protein